MSNLIFNNLMAPYQKQIPLQALDNYLSILQGDLHWKNSLEIEFQNKKRHTRFTKTRIIIWKVINPPAPLEAATRLRRIMLDPVSCFLCCNESMLQL